MDGRTEVFAFLVRSKKKNLFCVRISLDGLFDRHLERGYIRALCRFGP